VRHLSDIFPQVGCLGKELCDECMYMLPFLLQALLAVTVVQWRLSL